MIATTVVPIPDNLDQLAAAIDATHRAAVGRAKDAIDYARQCGLHLITAKRLVAHGDWLGWLAANTLVTARQSQKYMRSPAEPKRTWVRIRSTLRSKPCPTTGRPRSTTAPISPDCRSAMPCPTRNLSAGSLAERQLEFLPHPLSSPDL
jgi:hypothetical protein